MALRDQPYIPLYIQDFLTDEKLIECSAASTGIYIRLMCIMHKSETYGKILLKQKYKQTNKQSLDFASQLAKSFPYAEREIAAGLEELLNEGVLHIEGDFLVQRRMVRDCELSELRASVGRKGGQKSKEKTSTFAKEFAQAKSEANTEYENEYESEVEVEVENEEKVTAIAKVETREVSKSKPSTLDEVNAYFTDLGRPDQAQEFFDYFSSNGWKVGGKAPMKDWQAAARRWVRNSKPLAGTGQDRIVFGKTTAADLTAQIERLKKIDESRNQQ